MRAEALATLLVVLTLASGTPAFSRTSPYYFYDSQTRGSESLFNPISRLINSGYFTVQVDNRTNRVFEVPYDIGIRNVFGNLSHPAARVTQYGWNRFITHELVPTSLRLRDAQWAPNYFGHLLGGGMVYRKTQEWYRSQRYPHPTALAVGTHLAGAVLNEIVENGGYRGVNVDPIADLYIFEPLGIVLFSSDAVAKFFSESVNMSYWPMQPAYDPFRKTLENGGHGFALKCPLPFSGKMKMFQYYGLQALTGLSHEAMGGAEVSVGVGFAVKDLVETDGRHDERTMTAAVTRAMGVFYERDDSLLMSLLLSAAKENRMRLNLYPGWVKFGNFAPGVWCAVGEGNRLRLGLNLSKIPVGVGMSASGPVFR